MTHWILLAPTDLGVDMMLLNGGQFMKPWNAIISVYGKETKTHYAQLAWRPSWAGFNLDLGEI